MKQQITRKKKTVEREKKDEDLKIQMNEELQKEHKDLTRA